MIKKGVRDRSRLAASNQGIFLTFQLIMKKILLDWMTAV